MATFRTTEIGTMNVQVRIGGDLALLRGVAKAVFEAAENDPNVLDRSSSSSTRTVRRIPRPGRRDLLGRPGARCRRGRAAIRKLADSYLASKHVIIAWCLGLTQHEHGVDTVREIVNLLLCAATSAAKARDVSDPRS